MDQSTRNCKAVSSAGEQMTQMIDPQTKRYTALAKIESGNVLRTDQNGCAKHDRLASEYVPSPIGNHSATRQLSL